MLTVFSLIRLVVDGAWGSWSAWSTCTVSCGIGGGVAERTRACDSPAADHGGLDCSGESNETTICNDFHCPSKPHQLLLLCCCFTSTVNI